jgi:hypothetical protein
MTQILKKFTVASVSVQVSPQAASAILQTHPTYHTQQLQTTDTADNGTRQQ